MKPIAPKSEIHIIQLLDWIHDLYDTLKKESEERPAVRRS